MKANTSLPKLLQLDVRKALMAWHEKKHQPRFWSLFGSILKLEQILPILFTEMYFHTELHRNVFVFTIHLVPIVLPYSLKHSGSIHLYLV